MTRTSKGASAKPSAKSASAKPRAPAKPRKKPSAPARASKKTSAPANAKATAPSALTAQVKETLTWLERQGSQRIREDMVSRYGIHTENAFGVSVGALRLYAKRLGKSHELAAALWDTRCYEARMLATFVDEPALVTPAQMDRWCRDFDNWAICDTACFHFFDRTPHAWAKILAWAKRREEFVKRAAFALLASIALHDKGADDASFARSFALIEGAASDERNFVKKAVNWALRGVGRRSVGLNARAVVVARRLSASTDPTARWIGKDALRELTSPAVLRRLSTPKKT